MDINPHFPESHPGETLLTTTEICRRLRITPRTAQRWRSTGHGPEWIKLTDGGPGQVRYLESGLRTWLESRRRGPA